MTGSTVSDRPSTRRRMLPFLLIAAIPLSCAIPGPAVADGASRSVSVGLGPPTLMDLFGAGAIPPGLTDRPPADRTADSPTNAAVTYERQCLGRLVKLMQIDARSRQFRPGAVGTAGPAGAPDLAGLLGDDARTVSAVEVQRFELMHRNCMAVNAGVPPLLTPNERLSHVLSRPGTRPGGPLRAPNASAY